MIDQRDCLDYHLEVENLVGFQEHKRKLVAGDLLAALGLSNPATVLFVGSMLVGTGTYCGVNSLFSRQPGHAS